MMANESGAMLLERQDVTAKIVRYGTFQFDLNPGEEIKIERQDGEEPDILRFSCPDHVHHVDIRIVIKCEV